MKNLSQSSSRKHVRTVNAEEEVVDLLSVTAADRQPAVVAASYSRILAVHQNALLPF